MRRAWLCLLCLPVLFLMAPAACAQAKAADTPTIVVRVASLNGLLQNLNLVVKLVGQEEAAHQIEGLVKSKIGKKGLEGIDPARPIGAYLRFGKALDEVSGAILIPMADEKTFLTLLDNLSITYVKDKAGIYTHKTNQNMDVYFRFAHKYLYITSINTESILDKNLPDPAKALAIANSGTLSIVARIDQIPNDVKLIAVTQLEEVILAAEKKPQPGETKIQAAFRVALLRDVNKLGASLLREAGEIRFDLDIDQKRKELTVNLAVAGKAGSDLAKTIQNIGTLKSPLAGMLKNDLAFQGAVHFALPDELNAAFGKVIDEVSQKSLDGIQDPAKKKQAETLFKALLPTAKSGEFQVVAAVLGPKDDRYTFVGAVKLKDGAKLGSTVHALVKDALSDIPPAERGKIHLDFDNVGAIKIHKFQLPKDANTDQLLEQIAGDDHLYVAFRDDALFLALGKDALASLKAAVAKTQSGDSLPLVFDFDVARMARLMAKNQEQKDLANKLFPSGKTSRVAVTVSGGSRLTARLEMQLNLLEFLVKLQEKKE